MLVALSVTAASVLSAGVVSAGSAGAATLTPVSGPATFTGQVMAYRLRSYQSGGSSSMLVGVPDLSVPANSNGALTAASTGPYTVSFANNGTSGDYGAVTPTAPTGMFSTTYPVSPYPTGINTVQIVLTAHAGDTVSFTGITVNGNTIPNQTVTGGVVLPGVDTICVSGLSLNTFSIGGVLTRSTESRIGNTNMVDIQVGAGSCSPSSATPEFPLPVLAPIAAVGLGAVVLITRRRHDRLHGSDA